MADFIMKNIGAVNDYFIKVSTFELGATDMKIVLHKLLLRMGQAHLPLYWQT